MFFFHYDTLHSFLLFLFFFALTKGSINLITKALAAVGRKLELIPDPTTVHYHMPNGLSVVVHRDYEVFIDELIQKFPHETEGIRGFYGECWKVYIFRSIRGSRVLKFIMWISDFI